MVQKDRKAAVSENQDDLSAIRLFGGLAARTCASGHHLASQRHLDGQKGLGSSTTD